MKINDGTFAGVEQTAQPTDPKSETARNLRWLIIASISIILLLVAAVCTGLWIVSHTSVRGISSTKVERATAHRQHQGYRYGWITLAESESPEISIASDDGENIFVESGEQTPEPVKAEKKVNGKHVFDVDLGFGNEAIEYTSKGQVFSVTYRARDKTQVGKRLVYVLCRYNVQPPDGWRLEAIREMNGIR